VVGDSESDSSKLGKSASVGATEVLWPDFQSHLTGEHLAIHKEEPFFQLASLEIVDFRAALFLLWNDQSQAVLCFQAGRRYVEIELEWLVGKEIGVVWQTPVDDLSNLMLRIVRKTDSETGSTRSWIELEVTLGGEDHSSEARFVGTDISMDNTK
jgi:hypothetical protein